MLDSRWFEPPQWLTPHLVGEQAKPIRLEAHVDYLPYHRLRDS